MSYKRILCAVDFSAPCRIALDAAAQLATSPAAALTLLHVLEVPLATIPEVEHSLHERVRNEAMAELSAWKQLALDHGAKNVDVLITRGVPWAEVVRHALEMQNDLIVVGTMGRTGLSHVLFGSVSERIVRHAPCHVLVARERVRAL